MDKWINVDERYPVMGLPVLVYGAYEDPVTAYRTNTPDGPKWNNYVDGEWLTGITHWMLLPYKSNAD